MYTRQQILLAANGKPVIEQKYRIGIEFNTYCWTWFREWSDGQYDFAHIFSQNTGKYRYGYKDKLMSRRRIDAAIEKNNAMTPAQETTLSAVTESILLHKGYNISHHIFEGDVYVQADTLLDGQIEIAILKSGGIQWISRKLTLIDYDIKNK